MAGPAGAGAFFSILVRSFARGMNSSVYVILVLRQWDVEYTNHQVITSGQQQGSQRASSYRHRVNRSADVSARSTGVAVAIIGTPRRWVMWKTDV